MSNAPSFRVVIPARFASSRFPGKPLALLGGRPMIQRVWEQARASGAAEVLVATDDERIRRVVEGFGGEVVMTDAACRSGTERVAEVAAGRGWSREAIVVNVQGDAPLVPPASIRAVAGVLASGPPADIGTLCTPLTAWPDYQSPHVVKVVADSAGRALYFSRAPIPATGHGTATGVVPPGARRHVGLYAYRVGVLLELAAAEPCALEITEQLEQLRALWLSRVIRLADAAGSHGPDVDTPEDLAAAEAWLLKASP